jgi:hypothetical protein
LQKSGRQVDDGGIVHGNSGQQSAPRLISAKVPAGVMPDLLGFKGFVQQSMMNNFSKTCAVSG